MLHTLSIWLHVLSACIWIVDMAALGLLLLPMLCRDRFAAVSDVLFYAAALRFRWIGWGALGVLIVTGLFNVRTQTPWSGWVDLGFWTTA